MNDTKKMDKMMDKMIDLFDGDPYKTRDKRGGRREDSVNPNDIGIRRCGLCQFFGDPRPDRWGFCSKRNDVVHPEGLCELYIAAQLLINATPTRIVKVEMSEEVAQEFSGSPSRGGEE